MLNKRHNTTLMLMAAAMASQAAKQKMTTISMDETTPENVSIYARFPELQMRSDLPQRLSCRKGDNGFMKPNKLATYRVFFNGIEETICEVADRENGYIERMLTMKNRLTRQIVRRRSGKLYGMVEFVLRSEYDELMTKRANEFANAVADTPFNEDAVVSSMAYKNPIVGC